MSVFKTDTLVTMHQAIEKSRERRKQAEIQHIHDVCSPLLQGKSAKVYLFGSYATGQFSSQSDVDVLIVTNAEKAARACAARLSGDTVMVSPDQLQENIQKSIFWKNIDREKEMIDEYSE